MRPPSRIVRVIWTVRVFLLGFAPIWSPRSSPSPVVLAVKPQYLKREDVLRRHLERFREVRGASSVDGGWNPGERFSKWAGWRTAGADILDRGDTFDSRRGDHRTTKGSRTAEQGPSLGEPAVTGRNSLFSFLQRERERRRELSFLQRERDRLQSKTASFPPAGERPASFLQRERDLQRAKTQTKSTKQQHKHKGLIGGLMAKLNPLPKLGKIPMIGGMLKKLPMIGPAFMTEDEKYPGYRSTADKKWRLDRRMLVK